MNRFDEENGINWTVMIPRTPEAAATTLIPWIGADSDKLTHASKKQLLKAWNALAYLFPGLHPDDGIHDRDAIQLSSALPLGLPNSLREYYEESGWPVALVGLLDEMWLRYEKGEINDEEFYCADAAKAGIANSRTVSCLPSFES
jgi:hypothetical protein